MKETKRRLERYSFYDHTGIRRHLEHMAAQGWMLESIGSLGWRYRRIEPAQLRFSVVYCPDASDFNPVHPEKQAVLLDYCEAAGWRLAAEWSQMQIFFTELEAAPPIETDAELQVETVHRAMRKNFIPSALALLAIACLQIGMFVWRLSTDLIGTLLDRSALPLALIWLLLLGMTDLLPYYRWRRKAKLAAQTDGSFLETHSSDKSKNVALLAVGVLFLLAVSGQRWPFFLAGLLLVTANIALLLLVKRLLKRWSISAGVARAAFWAAAFIGAFALVIVFTALLLTGSFGDTRADASPTATYEYQGNTWTLYQDPIPLRLEDLLGLQEGEWSTQRTEESSLLLSRITCSQDARLDGPDLPELYYTVLQVRLPALYAPCQTALLKEVERWNDPLLLPEFCNAYLESDPAPWGASQAWQLSVGGEMRESFLLAFPDRLVTVRFAGCTPTPAQMAMAGETLSAM